VAIQGVFYVYAAVSDVVRAKKFYGETLGFRLNTDEPHAGGFWFGTGYLVVGAMAPATGSGGTHVAVRVDDVPAEHARLAERGVAVGPVVDQPWGERNFRFSDPDGNVWVYAQPIER